MRAALIALALSALAAPALAQEARIRTGEHDTFARLVLYLPEASDYRVETGERSFSIEFDGDFGFDTSDVFFYIPRTRVAEVSASAGRLDLDLACDCVATVERLSDKSLFIDVNDPGTVAATAEADTGGAHQSPKAPAPLTPAIRLPAFAAERSATLLPGGLTLPPGLPLDHESDVAEAAPAPGDPPDTSETTHAVAEQIARAASQGLLDVEPSVTSTTQPEPRSTEVADMPVGDEPETPEPATPEVKRHVSIRSSVDEALGRNAADALGKLGMTGPCLEDATFDVTSLTPEGVPDLSRLRSKVLGEFDRPDPKGVANLVRAYIGLTFGAEARHTIEGFKVNVPDADLLLAMSDIVDEGEASKPGRLAGQYDCPGAGAMWAALSTPEIPDDAELDADAVALAFSALPPQLRTRLGPTLAERLIDYGAVETASVVRTAILRAPGAPTVETQLLDATIAAEHGRDEEADTRLAEVVDETSGRNVEAVERLIERRLDAGEPIEDEVLAAADALIYEHRGTPLAYRLSELRIEGLATSGQARRALAFLDESERNLPAETVDRLRGVAYTEAARQLDDAEFLLVAVNAADELGRTPEEMAARRAVARRLGEMELYSLADSLGVEDGRVANAGPHTRGVPSRPSLGATPPADGTTLQRTAALLEHSAELRQRLAAVLGDGEAAETE